jgi:hypothetical protein
MLDNNHKLIAWFGIILDTYYVQFVEIRERFLQ